MAHVRWPETAAADGRLQARDHMEGELAGGDDPEGRGQARRDGLEWPGQRGYRRRRGSGGGGGTLLSRGADTGEGSTG